MLQEHYSFFIVPFYFDENVNPEKCGEWEECMIAFDKSKFYPHIQELLINDDFHNNTADYKYYRPTISNPLWKFLQSKHCIKTKNGYLPFHFNLVNDLATSNNYSNDFFSPKLILNTNTGVGLTIFCLTVDNMTTDNVIRLNYLLHKTESSSQNQPIVDRSISVINSDTTKKIDSNKIILRLKEKKETAAQLFGHDILEMNDNDWSWNFSLLADKLIKSVGNVERFDKYRFHVFSYIRLQDVNDAISLKNDIIRLSHIQTNDYDVTEYEFANVGCSFNNILYSSCTEGGAIVITHTGKPSGFIQGFSKDALKNYMWSYLMAIIQRHTLLNIERKFAKINFNKKESREVREDLRECIKRFTTNQANTWFADVSNFSHLNMFYRYCCKNLLLKEHNDDAVAKIKLLDNYVEVLNDEENGASIKKAEKLSTIIAAVVSALALFSALNDGFSFIKDGLFNEPFWACIAAVIVVLVACGVYYCYDRIVFKNKKLNQNKK